MNGRDSPPIFMLLLSNVQGLWMVNDRDNSGTRGFKEVTSLVAFYLLFDGCCGVQGLWIVNGRGTHPQSSFLMLLVSNAVNLAGEMAALNLLFAALVCRDCGW